MMLARPGRPFAPSFIRKPCRLCAKVRAWVSIGKFQMDEPKYVFQLLDPGSRPFARYDPKTDAVTFDWPLIEEIAASTNPYAGMAKILLAARRCGG
jgi:hypothetical protein